MTTYKYAFRGYEKEKMAKVVGKDLGISTKQAIEICTFIKGKNLQKAKDTLAEVARMRKPVPFRRFTEGAGHKRGNIAGGRYPVKASKEILALLNSLEANAQQKGLSVSSLEIHHATANKASRPARGGRIRGREAKRSHVELVAVEAAKETKKKDKKTGEKEIEKKPKISEPKESKKEVSVEEKESPKEEPKESKPKEKEEKTHAEKPKKSKDKVKK